MKGFRVWPSLIEGIRNRTRLISSEILAIAARLEDFTAVFAHIPRRHAGGPWKKLGLVLTLTLLIRDHPDPNTIMLIV